MLRAEDAINVAISFLERERVTSGRATKALEAIAAGPEGFTGRWARLRARNGLASLDVSVF
jgi:hypothetical protein